MVIAYLSVATERQHLQIQREEITQFIASKKVPVNKWVVEVMETKAKQPGPKLDIILGRLKKGDTLIVSDISRLSRTLYELMEILSVCLEKGVTVYCLEDRYVFDQSMDWENMIKAFKIVDEIDHVLVSVRTKEGLKGVKESGRRLGRPKGSDSKQSMLEANKDEVMNMLERGESVATICKHFNVSKNTYYIFRKNYGF